MDEAERVKALRKTLYDKYLAYYHYIEDDFLNLLDGKGGVALEDKTGYLIYVHGDFYGDSQTYDQDDIEGLINELDEDALNAVLKEIQEEKEE